MVVDVILTLAALHEQPHYRNFNPGLGAEVRLLREPALSGGNLDVFTGGAVYRDSCANPAWMAGAGVRQTFGPDARLHGGADLMIGYGDTTEWTGPVAIPSAFIGYGRMNIHIARMAADAVGFYLRYEVRIP